MTFKPSTWFPIAVLLSVGNLVLVGFMPPPWHAAVHAGLALAFGLWAYRLRQGSGGNQLEDRVEALEALGAPEALEALDALQHDVTMLRQELSQTQERLDFAERLLVRAPEARRVDPPR
jgi:hypothetical protein